ncbi:MAG: HAD-IA family hydrolase [Pseudomonadota bacterium]
MKLIIFDCDGTLVDSQHAIVEAMSRALMISGLPQMPRRHILSVVGLSLPVAVAHLLENVDEATVMQVVNDYRTAFRELRNDPAHSEPLYDGMLALVHTLAARDDRLLGVATGKSRHGMKSLFDRLDLHAHFITVQTADTHPSKPHPSMIEAALREAGVEPDCAVMVGDTTFDMEMARNADVTAIGVAWGYHPAEQLVRCGASRVAVDADDLLQAIDQSLQ